MAVGCNVDRHTQTETWEPTTTATEICLNPQLTETTITQNFVCCNERYPVASNDNSEGFQQPLSGKPSSIFIHHWRPRPVPRCTLVVCLHGYVPTCWGRPGSVEWIGVASPLFFLFTTPYSNGWQWNPWVLHARARSREWLSRLLRQATSKKYAYAANLRVDKLADFNDGVFFERSTNSSESVNLNSAL